MKHNHQPHILVQAKRSGEQAPPGLWSRLGQLFRRTQREPIMVKVWDATRGQYREVDLHDREDPLWFAARSLAGMQQGLSRKSAA